MNLRFTFLCLLPLMAGFGRPVSGQAMPSGSAVSSTPFPAGQHANPDYVSNTYSQNKQAERVTESSHAAVWPVLVPSRAFRWVGQRNRKQKDVYVYPLRNDLPTDSIMPAGNSDRVRVLPDGRWVISWPEPDHTEPVLSPRYEPFQVIRP